MENERLREILSKPVCFGSRRVIDALCGRLPDRSGVYILIHPKYGIMYIGKATSLRRRCKKRGWFLADCHVAWIALEPQDLDIVEQYMIRRYEPTDNVMHNRKNRRRKPWEW